MIHKIFREQPDSIIAVTGCYAQLKPTEVSNIEGVDVVAGNGDKGSLFAQIEALTLKGKGSEHICSHSELTGFFAAFSTADRTRSFLKVQDGCNYHCSYCTIPLARGESRNIPIADIVVQAKKIAASGQKEIVLTGINTGDFGRTTGETFLGLIEALDLIEGIERYRISSIEPNLLSDEVIDFCARSKKFQPHFHIPIQSGCDRILALMRRRYDTKIFRERIEKLRSAIPDVFIGIDVIVGFPSENDEDFDQTYSFLESLSPSFLHVFPYSVRPDTPAAEMDNKVPKAIISQRAKLLGELSERLHTKFATEYIGTVRSVLFESSRKDDMMFGYSDNYIKVRMKYDRNLVNTIQMVRLSGDGTTAELEAENISL